MSRVHFVATPGGHLDLLMSLAPAISHLDRTWVVSQGPSADALREAGEDVKLLPRFHGFSLANVRLAARSLPLVLRDRPRLIITAGSGNVLGYVTFARALGAEVIFTETMARITNASNGGRVFSRLASSVLVQWPDMAEVYAGARVCRPALLEHLDRADRPDPHRQGTLVAVGTHIEQFERLLDVVDDAVGRGLLPGPVIAQTGVARRVPGHFHAKPWLSPTEMDEAVARARYVVCHAGSGLIARALCAGTTPLVLPRLHRHGEHVDDHQEQITAKLGDLGLVVPLTGRIDQTHVRSANELRPRMDRIGEIPSMADTLAEEVERLLTSRRHQVRPRMRSMSSRRANARNSPSSTGTVPPAAARSHP